MFHLILNSRQSLSPTENPWLAKIKLGNFFTMKAVTASLFILSLCIILLLCVYIVVIKTSPTAPSSKITEENNHNPTETYKPRPRYMKAFGSDASVVYREDGEDAIFIYGESIDYTYNETTPLTEPERLISSPGCPRSRDDTIEGSSAPWVYYGDDGMCYLTGVQGPCPNGTKLSINPHSPKVGICQCDCYFPIETNVITPISMNQVWKPLEKNRRFCFDYNSNLHYVFIAEQKKCYPLLTQGPCKNNEWLVLDSTSESPKCEPRKCPIGQFVYYKTNSCEITGSSCQKSDKAHTWNKPLMYLADDSYWIPICKPPDDLRKSGPSRVNPFECAQEGKRFSKMLRKCVEYAGRKKNGESKIG